MARKSKLLAALDAHRGRDYEAEKRKSRVKAAEKRKRQKLGQSEENVENTVPEDDDEERAGASKVKEEKRIQPDDFANVSEEVKPDEEEPQDGETNVNGTIPQPPLPADASASEAENESDIPLSDLEDADFEDTVPHQKMTINNGPALVASRNRISLIKDYKETPFHYHNSLVSTLPPSSSTIADPHDDLTRELEFYRIARDAAVQARQLLKKESIPFSRPNDYFAEMVKSDEHMGKVKKKMYDDAAAKKGKEEARKLRDSKKFGKQVQVAREQERAKEKRDTLNKIKELKRKRKGTDTGKVIEGGDDLFQSIDVEDGPARDRSGRERGAGPNLKRRKRDEKHGFGGKKRFAKSGDALSSGDMRGFSARKMKENGGNVKAKRPGKNRRAAAR